MKKLFITVSLLLFTFVIHTNVHAFTCSIVDESGDIITAAKAGDLVYLKDSYINLKSGKMTWKLKANLPTINSKNYKMLINNSGYYYHEGSYEGDNNFIPIAIPVFDYIKGTAIITYSLSKAGKCSIPLYISEYVEPLPNTHTIMATAGLNGSITPSGSVAINHGDNQSFTIIPGTNYHVADVLVDGSSVGAVTSYTFTNVISDHTITASFSVEYDMWAYVVSKTTITKNFDKYDTDSNYNPTGGKQLNAGQLKETVMSSDTVKYEEIANGTVVETQTLIVSLNNIQVVDGNTLSRYRKINSSFGNCTVENHFDNYSPISGYNFQDVIQIKCGVYSMFYAKGIGKVVGQNHNSVDNGQNITHYYSVGVANL